MSKQAELVWLTAGCFHSTCRHLGLPLCARGSGRAVVRAMCARARVFPQVLAAAF